MSSNILPKSLEDAISTLSLESTLVLSSILINRALYLRNQELRNTKVDKLLKPDTAIKLPISLHKPLDNP